VGEGALHRPQQLVSWPKQGHHGQLGRKDDGMRGQLTFFGHVEPILRGFSARRPRHGPAPEHVHMGVEHALLREGAGVEQTAVPSLEALLGRDSPDRPRAMRFGSLAMDPEPRSSILSDLR